MEYQIRVKASVAITKQGDDLVFTDQWFGPFSNLDNAEQCVLNLSARPNIVNAAVINKEYASMQPGVRCLAEDCPGSLIEDGLGAMKCCRCDRFYVLEERP